MIKKRFFFIKKTFNNQLLINCVLASCSQENRPIQHGDVLLLKLQVEAINDDILDDKFDNVEIQLTETDTLSPLDQKENAVRTLKFPLNLFKSQPNKKWSMVCHFKVKHFLKPRNYKTMMLFPDQLVDISLGG